MTDLKNKYTIFVSLTFCILVSFQTLNAQENIRDSIRKFTLENCVNQFSLADTVNTNVGYQYWFVDKDFLDGRTLKMSVVAPNKSTHAPHKHLEDEFFFVLEGTATFYLDGKTTTVEAYSSFYCPSMVMHGISNAGDTELKYLVIKKYQRD